MSILTANLKHLYQRRGMWLVYPLLGTVAFIYIMDPKAVEGYYIGFAALPFFIGLLVTLPQIEVLSKSFSYCLPGHCRFFRRYVFYIGIAAGVLCSMMLVTYPELYGVPLLLVVCSAFFAGLTFYMAGVTVAMVGTKAMLVFVLLPLIGLVGRYDLDMLLERIIIGNVFPVVLVGILSSIAMWFWLGRPGLARRYCAGPRTGFLGLFNKERFMWRENARAKTRQERSKEHPRPWVEKWFLERMNKYDYRGPGRYFWGALYSTSAFAVSGWEGLLLFLPVVMIMIGYTGAFGVFALIIMPAQVAIVREAPVYSTMLISGGRHRRYTTTLWLAVTDAVLVCIATLVISGLSILLAKFMPTFALGGKTFSFRYIDPRVAIVPLLLLPFVSTMQLIFHRMFFLLVGSLFLPVLLGMYLGIVWRERVEPLVNPLSVVSLMVVSWGVFMLVLRHVCSKWCLVARGRSH
jgi:hypothetical protein